MFWKKKQHYLQQVVDEQVPSKQRDVFQYLVDNHNRLSTYWELANCSFEKIWPVSTYISHIRDKVRKYWYDIECDEDTKRNKSWMYTSIKSSFRLVSKL